MHRVPDRRWTVAALPRNHKSVFSDSANLGWRDVSIIEFEPGEHGLQLSYGSGCEPWESFVWVLLENSQATVRGVEVGWYISKINDADFDPDLLETLSNGSHHSM